VAMGPNQQSLDVTGSTTVTTPGGALPSTPGGFLALAGTNIGRHSTNWFVIVPEVNIQLGYQISSHVLVHVGYDFLFVNDVARPGNAVNPNINPTFLPTSSTFGAFTGLPQPRVPFKEEDFWAQGVEFGLELRF
jgi:Putative beta barrel porin-7 (BBP7)